MPPQQTRYPAKETARRWRRGRKFIRHGHSGTLYSGRAAAGFAQIPETYQPRYSRKLGATGDGGGKVAHCQITLKGVGIDVKETHRYI